MKVKKRNGTFEELQIEKIQKCIQWACGDLDNVSESQIELKATLQFYEGISTEEIHEAMIKSASDLITAEEPNYSLVSARLRLFQVRKQAFGQYEPPSLVEHVNNMLALGKYSDCFNNFEPDALQYLDSIIDHDLDLEIHFAGMEQLVGKYLVQNRVTGKLYESPQIAYMCMAMALVATSLGEASINSHTTEALDKIQELYEEASQKKLTLPTPIMGGLRSPSLQLSSCTLIECGDSLPSIWTTASAIMAYVSQRAGIGIGAGSIRGVGSEIRKGEAYHTGVIPFYKVFQAAVKSCSQGGIRGGAATLFYPLWHIEAPELLVLKNNRGTEENRVRNLDYGVQLNGLMYERLISGGNITLFSPSDVPGLYDAFFEDQDLFKSLYEQYEEDPSIRKRSIPAAELFSTLASERSSTGRIYIQHVDHSNTHSSFNEYYAPIRMSNLCVEITLPTEPLDAIDSSEGEIALCTLGAINMGTVDLNDLNALRKTCHTLVRSLDTILSIQDYPVAAAYKATMDRRPLGIGITNLAYFFAKNGVKYSDPEALSLLHRAMEAIQFYCIEASMELAKELGVCNKFHQTKYYQGIMPIDTYKRTVDEICDEPLRMNWDWLRKQVIQFGMRNSTLTAGMPCETSSQPINSTNGFEPPRGPVSTKSSKHGVFKQVVPDVELYEYEYLWDIKDPKVSINVAAVAQKFMDQSISTNTNYNPANYPNGKIPVTEIIQGLLYSYKMGLKTLYYQNTNDGFELEDEDDGCADGVCKL